MKILTGDSRRYIKSTDTNSIIKLKIVDYNNQPIDLTRDKVEVVIGNDLGRVFAEEPSIATADGEIEFDFDDLTLLVSGIYNLEVLVHDGMQHRVAPSQGYFKLHIHKGIDQLGEVVTTVSLQGLINQVKESQAILQGEYDKFTEDALDILDDTISAAEYATDQGDYAKEQGDYAKSQGDLVQDIVDNGAVVSVNGKMGVVDLTAGDVGADTSQDVDTKVADALVESKTYTDDEIITVNNTIANESIDLNGKINTLEMEKVDIANIIQTVNDSQEIITASQEALRIMGDKLHLTTQTLIEAGLIGSDEISGNAVDTRHLKNSSVTGDKILNRAIEDKHINDVSVAKVTPGLMNPNVEINTSKMTILRPDGAKLINNGVPNFDFSVDAADPPFMAATVNVWGWWYRTAARIPTNINFYSFRHTSRYLKFTLIFGMETAGTDGQLQITAQGGGVDSVLAGRHFSVAYTENYSQTFTIDLGTPTYDVKSVYLNAWAPNGGTAYIRVYRKWQEG